jgi:hypothetical protein
MTGLMSSERILLKIVVRLWMICGELEAFIANVYASRDGLLSCGVLHGMTGRERLYAMSDTLCRLASVSSLVSSVVPLDGGLAARDARLQVKCNFITLACFYTLASLRSETKSCKKHLTSFYA